MCYVIFVPPDPQDDQVGSEVSLKQAFLILDYSVDYTLHLFLYVMQI